MTHSVPGRKCFNRKKLKENTEKILQKKIASQVADVEETTGKKIYRKQIDRFAEITWKRTVVDEARMDANRGALYFLLI